MKRTVFAILAVGLFSLFLAKQNLFPDLRWPTEGYSLAMMAADAIAGIVVLIHPYGKVQRLIGLTFLLQMGVHAGRLLNGDNADLNLFWQGLSVLAFLQLILVGGWGLYEWLDRRRSVRSHRPVAAPAHPRVPGG